MHMHGIKARGKTKFVVTTDSKHGLPVAENLLARDFSPSAPDRVWSSDITYIATDEGWLYLASVIDLFNPKVAGWRMDYVDQGQGQTRVTAAGGLSAPGQSAPRPGRFRASPAVALPRGSPRACAARRSRPPRPLRARAG